MIDDDRGVDIPGPWLAASAFSRNQACTSAVQSHGGSAICTERRTDNQSGSAVFNRRES